MFIDIVGEVGKNALYVSCVGDSLAVERAKSHMFGKEETQCSGAWNRWVSHPRTLRDIEQLSTFGYPRERVVVNRPTAVAIQRRIPIRPSQRHRRRPDPCPYFRRHHHPSRIHLPQCDQPAHQLHNLESAPPLPPWESGCNAPKTR